MPNTSELTLDITPKIVKVTADVELHVDGRCIGTTTVDLTPSGDDAVDIVDPLAVHEATLNLRERQQSQAYSARQ